jgi:hypothetical protein
MVIRAWFCLVVMAGILLGGCGGSAPEERSGASPAALDPPEDVKVDMKQDDEGYSVHLQNGTEELKLQAEGSGDDSYSMVLNSKEGQVKMSAGSAAKLPDGFPQDVPTYPGMTLTFSQSMKEKETFNLQATSTDSLDKVSAHFKSEATAKGWTETTSLDQNGEGQQMKMMAYSKEDRILNIVLTSQEGVNSITISTAKQ